jgi:hypothetical protein
VTQLTRVADAWKATIVDTLRYPLDDKVIRKGKQNGGFLKKKNCFDFRFCITIVESFTMLIQLKFCTDAATLKLMTSCLKN